MRFSRLLMLALLALALLSTAALTLVGQAAAVVDLTAPTITSVDPPDGATVYSGSLSLSGSYSDEAGGSGIDPSSAMIHLDNRMLYTGCVADETHISCPKSGLKYGSHKLEVFIMDNAGNETVSTTYFTVGDNLAPAVTFTGPTDWVVNHNDPVITGTVSDAAPSSGIASASATVKGQVFPCTVDNAGNISCPTSGLPEGHDGVLLTVIDTAGNTGTASGAVHVSFCTGERPALKLSIKRAYWASYTDYQARNLSLELTVANIGGLYAHHAKITDSVPNPSSVTLLTAMPKSVGSIAAGASKNVTLAYHIPAGVSGFRVTNYAFTEDGCGQYVYP